MHNVMEDRQLRFERGTLKDEFLLKTYHALVKPRIIEEKMLSLLRQGKISKWFSGIGQEAISVGATLALRDDEYILPMHRNLGVFTTRNMPFSKLFAQWQGKATGYSKGRERSFHFGSQEHKVVGMISHLGPQMGIADGIALAHKLKKENRCTIVFTGDGATSEGDFHESVNVAAVWELPVIFVIENNGYGLSTPSSEQFRMKSFVDKAIGYGIEAQMIAGNNILEVYQNLARIADSIRERPRPVLVECITFRMRGHEEASGTKYVPKELFEEWAKKDPVANYENWLLQQGILTEQLRDSIRAEFKEEIESGLAVAFDEPEPVANEVEEVRDVYAPMEGSGLQATGHRPQALQKLEAWSLRPEASSKPEASSEKRFIDAISDGLAQSMERHPNLVLMGQDIAEYGGAFKITEGFVERFGKERVRNTPLCESAILGAGLGLSIKGMKAMVEMQFADFVSEGMTQICNNMAKAHWRWGQNADVVVRMPTGAGVGAGPFHSQSNEMWFVKTAGLKVVYPSTPFDAKGLLMAAFDDPNPVMFFEHKNLYRSLTEAIPDAPYAVEIGKARTVREGNAMSIITYGMGVHWATDAVKETGIDAEIIDLRTLVPMDTEAIYNSVRKTGRVLVLHEDTLTAGLGGEISALINEHCFQHLDAPVMRLASWDTPVPFAIPLEQGFLPKARVGEAMRKVMGY